MVLPSIIGAVQHFNLFTQQMQDGWGLATDGKILYGSDGTSTLYQIDPDTSKVIGKHIVKYNGHDVRYLNELEYIMARSGQMFIRYNLFCTHNSYILSLRLLFLRSFYRAPFFV
ncbi:hypothetical protein SLE2022_402580 [Rubroshorea leprosula]